MKRSCFFILAMVGLVFCRQQAFAQKDSLKLVTIDIKRARIEQLVLDLEKQTNIHFYYDPALFDSTVFNISVEKQPLVKVLEDAFSNTDFQFSIGDAGYAFITRGKGINMGFPDVTFTEMAPGNNQNNDKKDKDEAVEKNGQVSTLENKVYIIGDKLSPGAQPKVMIAGYVTETKTGAPVPILTCISKKYCLSYVLFLNYIIHSLFINF